MSVTLPTSILPPITQDPKNLILFSVPKIGKTSSVAQIPNNLIIDLESGTDYVSALKVKCNTVQDIRDICVQIREAGCPYDFITIDTVTALEEIVKPLALQMYQATPAGSKYTGDILRAPMGAGYSFQREALEKVISMVSSVTRNVIIIGHVKDKMLTDASGADMGTVKAFDLTGKSASILSAKSDAIGFVKRGENSELIISFKTTDALAGARPEHLANKEIVVATRNEDGTFNSHWERVFPSLIQK